MNLTTGFDTTPRFMLRFESLFFASRGLAFPCDAGGRVDVDALSERGRNNYFYARAMLGRAYAHPRVEDAPASIQLQVQV